MDTVNVEGVIYDQVGVANSQCYIGFAATERLLSWTQLVLLVYQVVNNPYPKARKS